jgi:hypothetical protein
VVSTILPVSPSSLDHDVHALQPADVAQRIFDAYKVEISSAGGGADKMTIWVSKDSRQAVKISAVLPQMGGAVLTAELQ